MNKIFVYSLQKLNILKHFLIPFFTVCFYFSQAQNNSAEIYLNLKKLNVLGSVLYIGAHPDDENNTLLPYLAKEKLYRTAYLSLTRGDGGQNLIGDEQGIELGMIRTQELLEARKIDGSEQYFTTAYEFGFSKSADETLHIWDKEKVLADVVWVIRKYQPDVIINRFPPDKRAGHGHHAAAAIIAEEAFTAAADATKFPEQFKHGVQPWQAKRIVWNTFNFGNTNTTNDTQLKLEIGNYNALLGKSYGEIGGIARTMHKSQGEGRPQRKGSITEYFAPIKGDSATNDFMENINTTWSRINGAEKIQQEINAAIASFNFESPSLTVPKLVSIFNDVLQLNQSNNWVQLKTDAIQKLILQCSGIFIETTTNTEFAVQGEKLNINFFINNQAANNVILKKIYLATNSIAPYDTTCNIVLTKNANQSFSKDFLIPSNAAISQPYWLEKPIQDNMFQTKDYATLGNAENEAAYTAQFIIQIEGTDFTVKTPVQYKFVHPVRGEIYEPLTVMPPVIVALSPSVILNHVVENNKTINHQSLQVQYTSYINANNIPVEVELYQGNTVIYKNTQIVNLKNSETYPLQIPFKNIYLSNAGNAITASVSLNINNKKEIYTLNLENINYEHIFNQHYFFRDTTKVINEKINTKVLNVGYIAGAGDKIPEALQALNYKVTFLSEKDINITTLQQFDAIVTGIRAYNIHEYLTDKNNVINEYIKNGGNLIVQYIKANTIGSKNIAAGPYSFAVNARSRVTEENAAVKFLLPQHEVLNYPNKITNKDFENWVQERSTYQAEKLDKNFECIVGMNDTGEPETNSSLIIAKYGKGNFVYCGLTLFRQLPAGIAGGYKLLANMIALSRH